MAKVNDIMEAKKR